MHIKIRAVPNSKEEYIKKKGDDIFKIAVKEKPERNKANKRILELISRFLNIPNNKIKIIKGHKRKNKIIEIRD